MTNPYLRAARAIPAIKTQAIAKLEHRHTEVIDGILMERARNADGTFRADDPLTPENEAWVEVQA